MSDRMLSNDVHLVEQVARDLADLIAEQDPRLEPMPWEACNAHFQNEMRRSARSILASIQSHLNDRMSRNEKGLALTYWHGVEPMDLKGKFPTD